MLFVYLDVSQAFGFESGVIIGCSDLYSFYHHLIWNHNIYEALVIGHLFSASRIPNAVIFYAHIHKRIGSKCLKARDMTIANTSGQKEKKSISMLFLCQSFFFLLCLRHLGMWGEQFYTRLICFLCAYCLGLCFESQKKTK